MVQIWNDHSENITFTGLVFDLKRPTVSEFRVLEAGPANAVIQIAEGSDYAVERKSDKDWLLALDGPAPDFEEDDVLDNIRITGNHFDGTGVSARSVKGLVVTGNDSTAGPLSIELAPSCTGTHVTDNHTTP
jgi:hypothetical protein